MDPKSRIAEELRYFRSDSQRTAFLSAISEPTQSIQGWGYGPEQHDCTVIARNVREQLVYCATGFGPGFPWSVQVIGQSDLGQDGAWCAYLYEAFVTSSFWPDGPGQDLELMAPGERS